MDQRAGIRVLQHPQRAIGAFFHVADPVAHVPALSGFRAALSVMREIQANADLPAAEQIGNGGFESPLAQTTTDIFGWVVNSRQLAQDSADH